MYKIKIIALIIGAVCLLKPIGALAQDNFTYYSNVNLPIPPEGDPGLWDTISVPIDIVIEDANFYVGIETYYTFAGQYVITITSPWGAEVTLSYRNINNDLPLWFDSEAEEDGPGDLDDYVGYNARGDWVMHVYCFAGASGFDWDNWAVEIVGQPVGIKSDNALPLVTGLDSAYPNPFNSQTIVYFSIADKSEVQFAIYDVTGRRVKDYDIKSYTPGHYQLKWNGTNNSGTAIASGIYFLKMTVGADNNQSVFTHKLTLLK